MAGFYHLHSRHIFIPLFLALFLVALVLTFVVETYYTRAFGDVLSSVSPKKVVPFSRVWLWVPVVVGILLVLSLTKPQAPGILQWSIFVGYPVVMISSFVLQGRKKDAYGGVPVWPFVFVMVFYILVPGIIRMDSQHVGLNNFALQDWILGVFLVGSGIYNHLQLTRTLRRISGVSVATQPFEEIAALDRLIHDPARLAIMTALSTASQVDFLFLQRLTGLTKGNLSSHLAKLEEAGMVRIEKEFLGKVPHTLIQPTQRGFTAITEHWQQLQRLHNDAQIWQTDRGEGKQLPE
jgi:DNA-binding MarR family transcriptional regulator